MVSGSFVTIKAQHQIDPGRIRKSVEIRLNDDHDDDDDEEEDDDNDGDTDGDDDVDGCILSTGLITTGVINARYYYYYYYYLGVSCETAWPGGKALGW